MDESLESRVAVLERIVEQLASNVETLMTHTETGLGRVADTLKRAERALLNIEQDDGPEFPTAYDNDL